MQSLQLRLESRSRESAGDKSLEQPGSGSVPGPGPGSETMRQPGPGSGTVRRPEQGTETGLRLGLVRDAGPRTVVSTEIGPDTRAGTAAPDAMTISAPALRLTAAITPAVTSVLGHHRTHLVRGTGMTVLTVDITATVKLGEDKLK